MSAIRGLKVAIDVDTSAFQEQVARFAEAVGWAARDVEDSLRRFTEAFAALDEHQAARSRVHAAYRAKTRRRNRR